MTHLKIASFFSGAGGLDLGFERAGFDICYANDNDPKVKDTYLENHPNTPLDTRSLWEVKPEDVPQVDGIIGGPPCQSWSSAGKERGEKDPRGQLFYPYISIIKAKRPKFFVAENVKGLTFKSHKEAFEGFLSQWREAGYKVQWKLLNAWEYGVPQLRERVIIVGIRSDLPYDYSFPDPVPMEERKNQRDAISDIRLALPSPSRAIPSSPLNNLEYLSSPHFPPYHMDRHKVRPWNTPSLTIVASAVSEPLHPSSRDVKGKDEYERYRGEYRRLSIRECARIQTFPDSFDFHYSRIADGYKMVGNAVPPLLAFRIAKSLLPLFSQ